MTQARVPRKASARRGRKTPFRLELSRPLGEVLVAGLILAGVAGRMLVPSGFMPGHSGDAWIRLCPASSLGQLLAAAAEHHREELGAADSAAVASCHGETQQSGDGQAQHHGHATGLGEESSSHDHSDPSNMPAEHDSGLPCPVGSAFTAMALVESFDVHVELRTSLLRERRSQLASAQAVSATLQARGPPLRFS